MTQPPSVEGRPICRNPLTFARDSRPRDDYATGRHLAFGHGIHYGLGVPLARMETEIALSDLLTTFPDLALAVPGTELRPLSSVIIDSVAEILVSYTCAELVR